MVKRSPVGKSKTSVKKSPKILKDKLKDYAASIKRSSDDCVVEVLTLSDDDCIANVKLHISTQSLALDKLLNGQGFPTGRVTEIYGPPHIGKSTILDHAFASVQSMGGVGVLFDSEAARDIKYTGKIGVNVKELQMVEFNKDSLHIENIMGRLYDTIEWWATNYPDTPVVIGWDALGGTATRDELKKRLADDEKPAGAAKVMRSAARQIPAKLGGTKIAVIINNHEYESFGHGIQKKETYGGAAVRHLSTIRMKLHHTKAGWIRKGDDIIGRKVGAYLEKNRLGKAYCSTEFALISGIGIDNLWSVYEELRQAKIIVVSGGWSAINLDGEVLKFQGWRGLADKCAEDATLFPRLVSVYGAL